MNGFTSHILVYILENEKKKIQKYKTYKNHKNQKNLENTKNSCSRHVFCLSITSTDLEMSFNNDTGL